MLSEFREGPRWTQKVSERRESWGWALPGGMDQRARQAGVQFEHRWVMASQRQRIYMFGRGENMETAESGFRPAATSRLRRR